MRYFLYTIKLHNKVSTSIQVNRHDTFSLKEVLNFYKVDNTEAALLCLQELSEDTAVDLIEERLEEQELDNKVFDRNTMQGSITICILYNTDINRNYDD